MKWPVVSLSDVCTTGTGTTPLRLEGARFYGGSIPWVKSGELSQGLVTQTEETLTEEAIRATSIKVVEPGAILVALYGATVGQIAELGVRATTNQAVCHIIPDARQLNKRFLYYSLKKHAPVWISQRFGGGQPNISQGVVKATPIPLPCLPEQRRIADILDEADALRRKRTEAIRLANELVPSLFYEMFGDPRLNPHGWEEVQLEALILEGPQNGLYRPASDYGSGTPIVRIDSFQDGVDLSASELKRVRLDPHSVVKYGLNPGEILINRVNSRSHIGKAIIVPDFSEPVVYESNMMRFSIRQEHLHPLFLLNMVRQGHVRNQIQTRAKDAVNQASINQDDVRSIRFPLPPRPLQEKFGELVSEQKRLLASCAASDNELDNLFHSLLQRAFRGDL